MSRPERVQAAFEVWEGKPELGPSATAMFEYIVNLEAEIARLREFVKFVKNAPVSSGVCCCGGNMDHSPYEGHTPVDMWDHSLRRWLEELNPDTGEQPEGDR